MSQDSISGEDTTRQSEQPPRLLERVFYSPAPARVLDHLYNYQEYDYSVSEIARSTGLSFKTAAQALKSLARQGLVKTRTSGQAKMYQIQDCETELGGILNKFCKALLVVEQ